MNIDTVREAPGYDHYWQIVLNWSRDMGTIKKLSIHEMHTLTERLQSITAAALSTIDPEAKSQEPGEDVMELAKNIIDDVLEEEYGAIARAAALIAAHDEAIRRECADRAVLWQAKLCREDDWSCQMCTECNQLRAAIAMIEALE